MLRRLFAVFLGVLLLVGVARAGTPEENIKANLKNVFPDAVVSSVKPAPVPGFFQVDAQGYDTVYMTGDGRYMVQGDLLEIRGNQVVNVVDENMGKQRKSVLAGIDRKETVVFPATGKTKAVVYVFTDVDCPYCRKLHTEVPKMNAMGIEIRYLAFPRTGLKSAAAAKMDKVWCAVDRNAALSDAKLGQAKKPGPQVPGCKSPVAAQYALGASIGVRGTPAVFLEDGTEVGGYLSADDLAHDLKLK
jgi:thiol:disulfide interchange protein DsbC